MKEKLVRTTIWLPIKLWSAARKAAVTDKIDGGGSGLIRKAVESFLEARRRAGKIALREKRAPNVQAWFDAFNEARERWGSLLAPPRKLRPLVLTHPARRLIENRIEKYGLTRLVAILYKVPWDDYLMGRGRWSGSGHRLAVKNILNITEKINTIEVLEELEDPAVLDVRGRMASIEEELSEMGTWKDKSPLKDDQIAQSDRYNGLVEEWEKLKEQIDEK